MLCLVMGPNSDRLPCASTISRLTAKPIPAHAAVHASTNRHGLSDAPVVEIAGRGNSGTDERPPFNMTVLESNSAKARPRCRPRGDVSGRNSPLGFTIEILGKRAP